MLTIESSNNQSLVYLQSSIVSKFVFYAEKSMDIVVHATV